LQAYLLFILTGGNEQCILSFFRLILDYLLFTTVYL